MCRQVMFSLLVVALGLTSVAQGAKIIWVADNLRYNFDTNEPADIGFVQLLRDQGHEVDYKGEYMPHEPGNDEAPLNPEWQYWRELDPNKIAELEAADLIIVARDVASSKYDDTGEAETWNAISTPLIMQGPHLARRLSKWGWFDSGSTSNKTPRLMTVTAPDHAIFAGVELDPNSAVALVDPNTKVTLIKDPNIGAGNGRVLGLHDEGLTWIAEWDAGVEFYDGSGAFAGGPRMWFGSAAGTSDEALGIKEGQYNLTAAGETIFLNAVNYMLKKNTTIIYVCSVRDIDQDGIQDDLDWEAWLEAEGYTVDNRPGNWSDPLDVNEIAELDAADLIIASRGMSTGEYDGAEVAKWTAVTTPIICTNAWMIRSNRWKWMDSTAANKNAGAPLMMVEQADHPIFDGIETQDGLVDVLDPNVGSGHTSFLSDEAGLVGNGTMLASSLGTYVTTWIAEWMPGMEYYDGAGEIPASRRLLFMAGTQDDPYPSPTGLGNAPVGLLNLNDTGKQMFLNAVDYMLTEQPIIKNGSFELPGTDKFKAWDGEKDGEAGEPATDIPGWSSDTTPVDSGVETGWGATDGEWTAFLKGADPSVWQLTQYFMGADDVIELKVDAKNNWQATTLQLSIYIDIDGVRLPMAAAEYALTDAMQEFTLTFAVADQPLAAGMRLGVELANVSAEGESWVGLDNVRVEILK